ncbi:ParB/RepB/Spo0J family partition protein [Actinophytocola sp.]|uniref:ParB/RepB/Spo0J family partition protein n=1 Tax=Actinophytocola sp. TaxID=1872138 RepID=UPI002ECFFB1F
MSAESPPELVPTLDDADDPTGVGITESGESHAAQTVLIAELTVRDSPRLTGEDEEHVRRLAETDDTLPPILVHRSTMAVIDGVHRLRAAQLRGSSTIRAAFVDCPQRAIFVNAVRANVTHGMPLSLADRKAAAGRILISHPQWSDRAIAAVTGLAHKTVGRIRRGSTEDLPGPGARIGMDGHVRPVTNLGRVLAEKIISQQPGMSLRKVAKAAGISLSTAHDVRRKMDLPRKGDTPTADSDVTWNGRPVTEPEPLQRPREAGDVDDVPRADHTAQPSMAPIRSLRHARRCASVVQRLRADPSLRFTNGGRVLLRMLGVHALTEDDWRWLLDSVPRHWAATIAELAREFASAWEEFAARLDDSIQ